MNYTDKTFTLRERARGSPSARGWETTPLSDVTFARTPSLCVRMSSRSSGAAPPPSRRLSPSSADSVHPRRRCWWCTWSTTCATSSMELIITIKEVLAVQLGNAASTQQVPPAYHHRAALTACSLTAGCTLCVAGDRRATPLHLSLMPPTRLSSAAACWRAAACPAHRCVQGWQGRHGRSCSRTHPTDVYGIPMMIHTFSCEA